MGTIVNAFSSSNKGSKVSLNILTASKISPCVFLEEKGLVLSNECVNTVTKLGQLRGMVTMSSKSNHKRNQLNTLCTLNFHNHLMCFNPLHVSDV